jgi:hypothetical protein
VPQTKGAHIVGYYAPAARIGVGKGLGHRDGAKRQSGGRAVGNGQRTERVMYDAANNTGIIRPEPSRLGDPTPR